MKKYFDIMQKTRINFLQLLDGLTIEQLNTIPTGFNNNLIWNFAHLLATQQVIFYGLANLTPNVDEQFIKSYRRFTKPEAFVSEAEFDTIKQNFEQIQQTFFKTIEMGHSTNSNNTLPVLGRSWILLKTLLSFHPCTMACIMVMPWQ